jgi:hypothetical protein
MNTVKATSSPEKELCHCPAWLAGHKKGWPKKNIHEKSVANLIKKSAKIKCKRRRRMFCIICQMFGHNIADCRKNPLNQLQTLGEAMEEEMEKGLA